MTIRAPKDFWSGVMFCGFAVAFVLAARGYSFGNAGRMGPGYFPLLLAGVLAGLGAILIVRSIAAGLFSTSPRNRTSPLRSPSATATACFNFATSKATKASLYCPMARPPCVRLGSALPSNPRLSIARQGGPASPWEHDV